MDWHTRAEEMVEWFSHLDAWIKWHKRIDSREPGPWNSLSVGSIHSGTSVVLHDTVELASELGTHEEFWKGTSRDESVRVC